MEVMPMKMMRLNIQLPADLKAKLDAKRASGYTASGFIRSLLERELNAPSRGKNGIAIARAAAADPSQHGVSAGSLASALVERDAGKG
jgi:hypothetical protein